MERYILTREYPGSPAKDSVVFHPHREKAYLGDESSHFKLRNEGNVRNHIFYSKDYIEKFPKFWKKM